MSDMNPIKNNGMKKVEIDMGNLNCMGEPYVVDVGGNKFILRYKTKNYEGDFGTITLEAMAD